MLKKIMKKYNYIPIQLLPPDAIPVKKSFIQYSFLLKYAFLYSRDIVIAEADPNVKRDSSIKDFGVNIHPTKNGYVFEIGVFLPIYLPQIESKSENVFRVEEKHFFFSNRICEIITKDDPGKFMLCHLNGLQSLKKEINSIIYKKTYISTKFVCTDRNASICLEDNFIKWIHILEYGIKSIIQAIRYLTDQYKKYIEDSNNISSFEKIFIFCKGKKQIITNQFSSNLFKTAYRAPDEPNIKVININNLTLGKKEKKRHLELLDKSQLLFEKGEFSIACILACSSCELAFSNYLKKYYIKKGLSKKKIEIAFDDLKFSQMVNLEALNIINMKIEKNKQILGNINNLRKIRNNIIHNGKWIEHDKNNEIKNAIHSISELFENLKINKR